MADSSGVIKVAPPRIPYICKAIDGELPETGFFTTVYDAAEKDGWGIKAGTMNAAWKVPREG